MNKVFRTFQQNSGNFVPPRGLFSGSASLFAAGAVGYLVYDSLFTVQAGHRAVMFNKISGVKSKVYEEGTHLMLPYFEKPTIFDIRTKPSTVRSPTGTKDLQMIDITLRVLYRPVTDKLPLIFSQFGVNYADRILPSIVNETLKSVIAQFNAAQLITQREQVSSLIRQQLEDRAQLFHLAVDDVSITHLTFGAEYTAAVEAKQIAQQDAERAKYVVKQAIQDKKSTIIKAEGEAKSAQMIGDAIKDNPAYIQLRQLDASKEIANIISKSQNKVYLDSNTLLLNITEQARHENTTPSK